MLGFHTDNACNNLYHILRLQETAGLGGGGSYNVIPIVLV